MRTPRMIEYHGVTYDVISADAELALVHDPSIDEYGISDGTEVLIYASKAEAEHEFWFGDV